MPGNPVSPLLWSVGGDSPDQRSISTWCAYTGQAENTIADWGWLKALHPCDREDVRTLWKDACTAQHSIALTYRLRHRDEAYRSFRVLHVPLFTERHQLQNWFVFFIEEADNPPAIDENWELRLLNSMIFTQAVLGVYCLALDGTIQRVNDRMTALTGYTEAELLSMTIWQLSHPDDLHLHLQAMHERLTSNQGYHPLIRVRYLDIHGHLLWARVSQFLVRQPSGEPYYFFCVVEDINAEIKAETEHARLVESLREAHIEALGRTLQLETVFEAITDGIMVCDSSGQIIQSNSAVQRVLHLDSCPNFFTLPPQQRTIVLKAVREDGHILAPEEWPLNRLLRGESLQEGRAEDLRLILPDGVEIYANQSGAPMRDEQGKIIGAALIIHDVTERHLLESRIQQSFKILLALAEELVDIPNHPIGAQEALSNGQTVATPSLQTAGEYLAELTCQMLEYEETSISLFDEESEQLRLVAMAGFPREEMALYYQRFAQSTLADYLNEDEIALLRANEVVIKELSLHLNDPNFYTLLAAPMSLDGRLVGILTVEKKQTASFSSEEISLVKAIAKLILLVMERERIQCEWIEAHSSELALREANRRFDEFLSIASHELRTPLAGIKGNLQLAIRRLTKLRSAEIGDLTELYEKLDKMEEYLRQAEHRVNVQNRMISDLLDVSRIEANKLELIMSSCNLATVVLDAVKDQQYNVPERVITLNLPQKTRPLVIGDADRLGQVVHNYLTNALKYSPANQPISVSLEQIESEARVSVHDKGPGLTSEEQKRVWERFYRVKGIAAQGGSGPGLGLGLHICRTIIEAHQGAFGLESTPGEGSTFWFALPLVQSTTPSPEHHSDALSQRTTGS